MCSNNELITISTRDGVTHMYSLEKVWHSKFFKLMKHTPGKALNFIIEHALWHEEIM